MNQFIFIDIQVAVILRESSQIAKKIQQKFFLNS